jgi:hypothetical protein
MWPTGSGFVVGLRGQPLSKEDFNCHGKGEGFFPHPSNDRIPYWRRSSPEVARKLAEKECSEQS